MVARIRSLNDFLTLLKSVKQVHDGQYVALCPGHRDSKPSLSVKEADCKILLHCHAGCSTTDIVASLGLTMADLNLNGSQPTPDGKIVATYDYSDESGKLLYQTVRYEPKDFKQRRPDGNGGWIWNLKGVRLVLYRLPEVLLAVKDGQTIYKVAGEKDADNLRAIGLTATTNPLGEEKGKWKPGFTETLRGAHVVVIQDKDNTGRKHGLEVASLLYGKVASLKVLELPDSDGHQVKDASDWLVAGGTRQELEQLVSEAPEWKPPQDKEAVRLICMADVEAETVSWLWYPYIPKGKLTLLEGDPGVGKSWLSLAIATAVSLGKGLPGIEATEPAKAVLASAEDGLGDTIRPRLDAMGADVWSIQAIKGVLDFGNAGLIILEGFIQQVRPALVIIDPLVAYIGAGVDLHRANETRAVMSRLAEMAERYNVAILAIRHLTKSGSLKPIYRGLGSIDITAACRSVLLAGCDPENEQKRGMVHIKSNLAPTGKAIGYELRDDSFYWTGASDLTAGKILSAEDGEGKSAIDEAIEFLLDELAAGPVEASQIWKDARDTGLSEKTIKRAKAKLGIITKRQGETGKRGGGKFIWELADSHLEVQEDLGGQIPLYDPLDPLNHSSFKNDPVPSEVDPLNTTDDLLDYPTHPCQCGCTDFWLREASQWGKAEWLCSRCHPKPKGEIR